MNLDVLSPYINEFHTLSGFGIVGKLLAIFALLIQVYALVSPVEKTTKMMASLSSIAWAGAFLISGAMTAALMAVLSSVRQAVASQVIGSPKIERIKFAVFFIGMSALIGFGTYANVYSLVPIAAGVFSTYAYFFASNKAMRWILIFSGQLWLVTHWHAGIEEGVVSSVISSLASLVGLYRLSRLEKLAKTEAVEKIEPKIAL